MSAIHHVLGREENLSDRDVRFGEFGFPCRKQARLAHHRRGLMKVHFPRFPRKAERANTCGGGARGHEHNLLTALVSSGENARNGGKLIHVQVAVRSSQGGGTNLDHNTRGLTNLSSLKQLVIHTAILPLFVGRVRPVSSFALLPQLLPGLLLGIHAIQICLLALLAGGAGWLFKAEISATRP